LLEPGEPKDPDASTVFQVWQAFGSPQQSEAMRKEFANGIAWGEAKKQLFELVNEELREPRQRYNELMADRGFLESTLQQGAIKARAVSAPLLQRVNQAIGLRPMST